jgi:cellulose synthase/poly-beta-1,6-N-acetylglucosamine synthase-like glycosyltransferase
MEASEEAAESKAHILQNQFKGAFASLIYTIHPSNLPGETRGKSSNVAWAARHSVAADPEDRKREIITVMDADTCFAADYFGSVTVRFLEYSEEDRGYCMFAPCTVFDR